MGLVVPAEQRVVVGQPEGAGQERAFAGGQPVVRRSAVVAIHEAVPQQVLFDSGDGAAHARVGRGEETDQRDHQETGVEEFRAERLDEGADFGVEAVAANAVVDRLAHLAPAVERSFQAELFRRLDRPVDGDPGHDLGVGEVLPGSAHFPDALVGILPRPLDEGRQRHLQIPVRLVGLQSRLAGLIHGVADLAVHVELELSVCRVADADRLRAFVARQPRHLKLGQAAFAGQTVHDLRLGRIARDRPEQPPLPGFRLCGVPRLQEGEEGKRGIPQPAEAVVPIPHAADLLRQGGRRGGHDAARRLVRQRLQRNERAQHTSPMGAVGVASAGPLLPPRKRLGERLLGIASRGDGLAGGMPGQGEGDALTFGDREVGHRRHVLPTQGDRSA